MIKSGLYEQVINNQLSGELAQIPEARKAIAPIDKAEASKVLAQYLADVVQMGLDNVVDNGGDLSAQITLTNKIVELIQTATQEADFAALGVDQRAEQLLALLRENDPRLAVGGSAADLSRPETSVAQSSLFTGALHEPQMCTELKKEIVTADRIDMLVSFIKWSGLRLLMDELREFMQNGFHPADVNSECTSMDGAYGRAWFADLFAIQGNILGIVDRLVSEGGFGMIRENWDFVEGVVLAALYFEDGKSIAVPRKS